MTFARYEFDHRKSSQALLLPKWKQVHGVSIAEVTALGQDCGEVDGLWTRVRGLPIAVVTADCIPILLMNKKHGVVAALHAGWRGTFHRIVESFFESLPPEMAQDEGWTAILGPSIRSCCYEVSKELIEEFKEEFSDAKPALIEPSPRRLDLIEVNIHQLLNQGVMELIIHPDCTHCAKDDAGDWKYYSYRRGDRKSRQYSTIEIKL